MITATPTSPDGNAAYRAGLCVDCRTRRYSAGRPRCSGCHTDYVTRIGAPIQQAASTVGNLVAQGHGLTHVTVRGPGRCTERSFHVATQGHRERCSGTAPVEPAEDKPRSFFDRLARDAADDLSFYASCDTPVKRMADKLRAEAVAV